MWYNEMYESISKNNELENEMTLDMSYFWYSDVVFLGFFCLFLDMIYCSSPTNAAHILLCPTMSFMIKYVLPSSSTVEYHLWSYPLESRHASSQSHTPRDHIAGQDLWMQNTKTQSICGTISGHAGKDYHHLTCDLIETFRDHSSQDQVVETPTSKSQMIDITLVSDLV